MYRSGFRPLALFAVLSLLAVSPVRAIAQTAEDVERAAGARDAAFAILRLVNEELDRALVQYHDVNGELEQLTYRIGELFDRITTYERELVTTRTRAQTMVIEAYMSGKSDLLDVALTADTIQDILTSRLILRRAALTDLAAAGRLEVVRREMDRLKSELSVDEERFGELRTLAEDVVLRMDELQHEAGAAYREARATAADELQKYEEEQARLREEAARRAAIRAAKKKGAAAGVDAAVTPGFVCPAPGARFINDWGFPRSNNRTHKGTDMFALRGTPVYAAAKGTIELDTYKLGGIIAALRADHGVTYYYAHLDRYADGITDGQHVKKGQTLGFIGNTGNAIGSSPHLHFQIHPNNGPPVNPHPTLRRHC